jgi:hypothetical protein
MRKYLHISIKRKISTKKTNFSFLILSLLKSSSTNRHLLVETTFMRSLCCFFLYELQKIACAINQTNVYSSYFKHSLIRENWVNKLLFINSFIDVLSFFSMFNNLRKFVVSSFLNMLCLFFALSMQKSSTCLSVCRE